MGTFKYNIILFNILMFTSSLTVSSQDWPIIYGEKDYFISRSMVEDYDLGFVLSGYEADDYSFLGPAFILKTDINGSVLWKKTFGTEDHDVSFYDLKKLTDNGYLLSGVTNKLEINYWDPLFLKLNACGEIEWCTILNSELGSGSDYAVDAIELADGSIIGQIKYYGHQIETIRISLIKMNKYGEPLWIKHLAQEDASIFNEEGFELTLTSDSNYLITGNTSEPLLILSDSVGDEIWLLEWVADEGSSGLSIHSKEDKYGNFYTACGLHVALDPTGPAIIKTDRDGNQLYHKLILGDSIRRGSASPIVIYNDTTLVIGGTWSDTMYPIGEGYSEIFVTDTLGNLINHRMMFEYFDNPYNIIKTKDGKIVYTGNYWTPGKIRIHLWKMNLELEDDSIYTQNLTYDSLCNKVIVSDTVGLNCGIYVNIDELPTKEEYEKVLKIWPNPTNGTVHIKVSNGKSTSIRIINTQGKLIKTIDIPRNGSFEIDTSTWPIGIYMACLYQYGTLTQTEKVIVIR